MLHLKPLAAGSLVLCLLASAGTALAVTPASVGLGTAAPFAALAGQTITNTGPSVLTGDLGLSPGTAVTGFPPGTVNGSQHIADAVALQAQNDLTTAYNDAAGRPPDVSGVSDLGGLTLVPGVYNSASSMALTGTVTLDAQGDPAAVWIFQAGSSLITASSSTVALVNGGQACNVFWQVGSSATLGTNTTFVGTILALTSITVQTGSTIHGRALARNGALTLDTNVITRSDCAVIPPPSPSPTANPTPTPTPTAAPSAIPSGTPAPTAAPSATPTAAPSATPTPTPVPTAASSGTPVPTAAPSATPTAAPSATPAAAPVAVQPVGTATAAPTGAPNASALPIRATPAARVSPRPTNAVVRGPAQLATPNLTLPPTDTLPGDGRETPITLGGAMVALGGLLVLAAVVIAKRSPARR